ncbi:MAG: hypothetical protein GC178_16735 [Flavobacteriales bacterium]|nr:hypothetical protein [Flavobacteriales bacterium]
MNDLRESPEEQECVLQSFVHTAPSIEVTAMDLFSYVTHIAPAEGGLVCDERIACTNDQYAGFTDFSATHTTLMNEGMTLLCGDISALYDAVVHRFLNPHGVYIMELYCGPGKQTGEAITTGDYGHTLNIIGIPCGDTIRSYIMDALHGSFYVDRNGVMMETEEYFRLLQEGKSDSIVSASIFFARPHLMGTSVDPALKRYGITSVEEYVHVFDSLMGPAPWYANVVCLPEDPIPLSSSDACAQMTYEWRFFSRWVSYIDKGYSDVLQYYHLPNMKYFPLINSGYGFNHLPSPEEVLWAKSQIRLIVECGGYVGQ